MKKVTINTDLCHQDGICGMVCPTLYIQAKVGDVPTTRSSGAFCLQCGQCIAFCPHGAIEVEGLDKQFSLSINRKELPTPAATSLLLRSRRSIRHFKDTPVSQEDIERIIADASCAPTGKNYRGIRYIVLNGREKVMEFGELLVSSYEANIKENPQDPKNGVYKGLASGWRKGFDPIFRGAPQLILAVSPVSWDWAVTDCAISLTYLEIAANALGVGACWAGYVTATANAFAPVREFLGLEEGENIFGGQMVGYPKFWPKATAPRAPYVTTWL